MSLRLKEDPNEWMKFTAATAVAAGALTLLLWRRGAISQAVLAPVLALLATALLVCLVRPAWFRSFYRLGLTAGHHLGQAAGKTLLAIVFWLVLTPTGLFLRLLGKDLLEMKRRAAPNSYWHPARVNDRFDRQF
jgi:hypothetical protein